MVQYFHSWLWLLFSLQYMIVCIRSLKAIDKKFSQLVVSKLYFTLGSSPFKGSFQLQKWYYQQKIFLNHYYFSKSSFPGSQTLWFSTVDTMGGFNRITINSYRKWSHQSSSKKCKPTQWFRMKIILKNFVRMCTISKFKCTLQFTYTLDSILIF